jgi:excisionase family DNA binding protein
MEQLVTIECVAEGFGVKPVTVRRWIHDGRLPAYKLRRAVRVKQSDIDTMLEQAKIEPTSSPAPARARRAPPAGGLRELYERDQAASRTIS